LAVQSTKLFLAPLNSVLLLPELSNTLKIARDCEHSQPVIITTSPRYQISQNKGHMKNKIFTVILLLSHKDDHIIGM